MSACLSLGPGVLHACFPTWATTCSTQSNHVLFHLSTHALYDLGIHVPYDLGTHVLYNPGTHSLHDLGFHREGAEGMSAACVRRKNVMGV